MNSLFIKLTDFNSKQILIRVDNILEVFEFNTSDLSFRDCHSVIKLLNGTEEYVKETIIEISNNLNVCNH